MKKWMACIAFIGLLCTYTNGFADDLNKKIVGKWYNPYTYESTGEMRGFEFKKNGKCKALGIKTLDLRTWEVKDGQLLIKGFYLDKDNKTWEEYSTSERIEQLNADTLYVVAAEKPFKMAFIYLNSKILKKKVTPFSGQFQNEK